MRVVLVLLDGAQEEIDLSDDDLGQGARPGWAAGAGTGNRTQRAGLGGMGRVT